MCNAHLGQESSAIHGIELMGLNTEPIQSALYQTKLKAKGSEKAEIDRMHLQKTIKPAQIERATLIVLALKKTNCYASASTTKALMPYLNEIHTSYLAWTGVFTSIKELRCFRPCTTTPCYKKL